MATEKAETGKYSTVRTRRGNVQVGRLKGKSHLKIARDLQGLVNLNKNNRQARKKFKSALKKDLVIRENQITQ